MSTETAGIPAQPGESAPVAPPAASTAREGIMVMLLVDASGRHRDAAPARFACERDDGSPAHTAIEVEMPVAASALKAIAKLKCACGSSLGMVTGARVPTVEGLAASLVIPAATVTGG